MKIVFLGTNGWFTTPTGNTPCIFIDSRDHYIILDAGNGIFKLDEHIKDNKPISLFISHFHLDHVSGLHTLNKFNFKQGIDVYVGKGRVKDFETLVNPPFTVGYEPRPDNIFNLKSEIRLHELSDKEEDLGFKVTASKQHHAYIDHGYRFEIEGKTIAYTGDCGFTRESEELAKNVDLLICECSNKKTEVPDIWGHFDPIQAGTLAKKTGVKKMILTHFSPTKFPTLEDRAWAEEEAKKIFPHTTVALDNMEFKI